MPVFENPANGYQVEVRRVVILLAFLFGPLFFLVRGSYKHALIMFLFGFLLLMIYFWLLPIAVTLWAVYAFWLLPIVVTLWAVYAFMAPGILERMYVERGWRKIGNAGSSIGGLTAIERPIQQTPPSIRTERPCPWCAEQILVAAIVCKHCGRDVPAATVPTPPVQSPGLHRRPCPHCEKEIVYHPSRVVRTCPFCERDLPELPKE